MQAVRTVYRWLPSSLWNVLLFTLPVTSSPLLSFIGASALISPLSALPLFLLVITWLPAELWKKGELAYELIPLAIFFLAASFSTAAAIFLPLSPFKGATPFSRGPRALLTLVLGISFYLVTISILKRKSMLRTSLKMIHLGAVVMFVYTLVQVWYIYFLDGQFPGELIRLHRLISIREPLRNRLTAMTYEPSWFAHQLSIFYFPLWIGLVTNRVSAFRKRWFVSVELILLIIGIALIFLAQSRMGLIGMILMFAALMLWGAYKSFKWMLSGIQRTFQGHSPAVVILIKIAASTAVLIITIFLTTQVVFAAVKLAQQIDPRLADIFFDTGLPGLRSGLRYVFSPEFGHTMRFIERLAYWDAGWNIFEKFPVFGVGLGNAGFLFLEEMPAYSWRYPEVTRLLITDPTIFPNIKNLWIRLLAETGVVGFSTFISWLVLISIQAVSLFRETDRLRRSIGSAGILGMIVLVAEGFSIDSFAFPYFWILFGMVTAAYHMPLPSEEEASGSVKES